MAPKKGSKKAEPKPAAPRRATRGKAAEAGEQEEDQEQAHHQQQQEQQQPRSTQRSSKKQEEVVAPEKPEPPVEDEKPTRGRGRAKKDEAAPGAAAAAAADADADADEGGKRAPSASRRRSKKAAAEEEQQQREEDKEGQQEEEPKVTAPEPESAPEPEPADQPPPAKRAKSAKRKSGGAVAAAEATAAAEEAAARRPSAPPAADAEMADAGPAAAAAAAAGEVAAEAATTAAEAAPQRQPQPQIPARAPPGGGGGGGNGGGGGSNGRAGDGRDGGGRSRGVLTVQQIASDELTRLAAERWPEGAPPPPSADPALVRRLFSRHLRAGGGASPSQPRGAALLDLGGYLERYLLPTIALDVGGDGGDGAGNGGSDVADSEAHVLSVVALVAARLREGLPAWDAFRQAGAAVAAAGAAAAGAGPGASAAGDGGGPADPSADLSADAADAAGASVFAAVWRRLLALRLAAGGARWRALPLSERARCVEFLAAAMRALEDGAVRPHALRLVSLPLWHALSGPRREIELAAQPALAKKWRTLAKKDAKKRAAGDNGGGGDGNGGDVDDDARPSWAQAGALLVPALLDDLVAAVEDAAAASPAPQASEAAALEANGGGAGNGHAAEPADAAAAAPAPAPAAPLPQRVLLAERLLELLSDLLSQLPTRRFVRAVVLDRAVLERVRLALGGGVAAGHEDEDDDDAGDDDEDEEEEDAGGGGGGAAASRRRLDPRLRRLRQLLALAQGFARFPVDDHTGEPRTDADEAARSDARLSQLQRLLFKRWGGERAAAALLAKAAAGGGGGGGTGGGGGQDGEDGGAAAVDAVDDDDDDGKAEEDERLSALRALSLAPCSAVGSRAALSRAVAPLSLRELRRLVVVQLRLAAGVSPLPADPLARRRLLTEALLQAYAARPSQRQRAAGLPLYPTERLLFDEGRVPTTGDERGGGGGAGGGLGPRPLPLPRLNLQFLSVADYLLRCFELYRLEAAYEVRGDLCDALPRLAPRWEGTGGEGGDDDDDDEDGEQQRQQQQQQPKGWSQRVAFSGWARMALPLESFRVVEVRRPAVAGGGVGGAGRGGGRGAVPAAVTAELVLDVRRTRRDAADEWDGLRPHDVIFMCCVRPGAAVRPGLEQQQQQQQQQSAAAPVVSAAAALRRAAGLVCVRGARVLEVRDAAGRVMNDPSHPGAPRDARPPQGTARTVTLALDPAQYRRDVERRAAFGARRAARERRRRLRLAGAVGGGEGERDDDEVGEDPFLEEDAYASFNVVARRDGKENNFAALLDALRDALSAGAGGGSGGGGGAAAGGEGCVPLWLRDVLLGYGDPAAAHYTRLPGGPMGPRAPADLVPPGPEEEAEARAEKEKGRETQETQAAADQQEQDADAALAAAAGPYARCIDFRDTFLDAGHAAASFPQYRVRFLPPVVVGTSATHGALHGHGHGGGGGGGNGGGGGHGGGGNGGGGGAGNAAGALHLVHHHGGPAAQPDLAAAAREDDADAALARPLEELGADDVPRPPFRATFPPQRADRGRDASAPGATRVGVAGRRAALGGGEDEAPPPPPLRPVLLLRPYSPPNPGPYPSDAPRPNAVRFTPTQVEAVRSGVQPGLTLVVGPPGTGKTDTCAQVLSVLYNGEPGRRVLVATHSNAALNDLFAKLAARDVPERHLLRLGAGERDLDLDEDYSRRGRVDAALARRLVLLAEVARVARALAAEAGGGGGGGGGGAGVADPEAAAATCESAGNFWLTHVLARWERFLAEVDAAKRQRAAGDQGAGGASAAAHAAAAAAAADADALRAGGGVGGGGVVARLFPFSAVFADSPGPKPLLRGEDDDADMELARGCFRHLARVFGELAELRAFELLRGARDRSAYLAAVQARVVAMTVTHASLRRREFLELALAFDSLVMEEAGQVLDCESFLPMCLLQSGAGGGGGGAGGAGGGGAGGAGHRLRRVVLVGDHHQLPPVVQNAALSRGAGLDQPLFTRLVRLGVPHVLLDAQGRCRPSIARLFSWRYRGGGGQSGGDNSGALRLRDLSCVVPRDLSATGPAAGFSPYDYANPGLAFDFQLIDPNDGGAGGGGGAGGAGGGALLPPLSSESAPRPHYWQNLAEAEYAVALYQFMRLLGYPAERIALLTTYNGQAALLRDIVERRCCAGAGGQGGRGNGSGHGGGGGGHRADDDGAPFSFGRPGAISTVDKYQGRQSDYVVLSLVRTRRVGHLRDVRRLVVALSRARLGLYAFGSAALFGACPELRPAFFGGAGDGGGGANGGGGGLLSRPLRLALVRGEAFSALEAAEAAGGGPALGLRAAGDPPPAAGGGTHYVSGLAEMGALVAQVAGEQAAERQRRLEQRRRQREEAVMVGVEAAAAGEEAAAEAAAADGAAGGGGGGGDGGGDDGPPAMDVEAGAAAP